MPVSPPVAQFEGMSTLTNAKASAGPIRKNASLKPRLTRLPAAKGTTADLAAKVRAGKFAVSVDIAKVIEAVASRSSRRR